MIIELTKGKTTIVDDDLYEELSKLKWYATGKKVIYAYSDLRRRKEDHPFKGKNFPIHRLVLWLRGIILEKDQVVDHINRDGLDNRTENLRVCSIHQNNFNSGKKKKKLATSKYKGVYTDTRYKNIRYLVQIKLNYKSNHVGTLDDEETAAKVYDSVSRYYFKEYAYVNFSEVYIEPMSIEQAKLYIKSLG
jgi:hypothetical protein